MPPTLSASPTWIPKYYILLRCWSRHARWEHGLTPYVNKDNHTATCVTDARVVSSTVLYGQQLHRRVHVSADSNVNKEA